MKLITKLLWCLVAAVLLSYLMPSPVQADLMVRLEGFGEGQHPAFMVHSPMEIGPIDLAAGFAPEMTLEGDVVKYGAYVPTMDLTLRMLTDTGSGYFTRLGTGLSDWSPTLALGIVYAANENIGAEFSYKWGYVKNPDELEFIEGVQGAVVVGFYGKY